jgi:hypothetical protein
MYAKQIVAEFRRNLFRFLVQGAVSQVIEI